MVIFDLGICPYLDLEVPKLIWLFLAKVGSLKVWKVHRFDQELTLMLSSMFRKLE